MAVQGSNLHKVECNSSFFQVFLLIIEIIADIIIIINILQIKNSFKISNFPWFRVCNFLISVGQLYFSPEKCLNSIQALILIFFY